MMGRGRKMVFPSSRASEKETDHPYSLPTLGKQQLFRFRGEAGGSFHSNFCDDNSSEGDRQGAGKGMVNSWGSPAQAEELEGEKCVRVAGGSVRVCRMRISCILSSSPCRKEPPFVFHPAPLCPCMWMMMSTYRMMGAPEAVPAPPISLPLAAVATPKAETMGTKPVEMGRPDVVRLVLDRISHQPYLWDITHLIFWTVHLLTMPLYIGVLYALFIHDIFTGIIHQRIKPPEERGAVLVTGCDMGFGWTLVTKLAKMGWKVYAGCLTPTAMAELSGLGLPSLVPVQMDVTNEGEVDAVVRMIEEREEGPGGLGLYCVVNNAGLGPSTVVDWTPIKTWRKVFDVNVFGTLTVIKATLPLLKRYAAMRKIKGLKGRARIVNHVSFAGIFTGQWMMGCYASSKHAMEALSSSLKCEIEQFGVEVVTVNPSLHATSITATANEAVLKDYDALGMRAELEYGPQYREPLRKALDKGVGRLLWDPHNVIMVLQQAVTTDRPRGQYIVGLDARFSFIPLLMAPRRVVNWFCGIFHPFTAFTPAAVADPSYYERELKEMQVLRGQA